ncbi:MAG: tyrosine-type recombinase/integrase, partial [Caldilineaceae bacterium]
MPTNKLTDALCKRAEPRAKPYKMADGLGMSLCVLSTGAKSWRFFYRDGGKLQTLALGLYPEVSLAEARRLRDAARARLRAGEPARPGGSPAPAVGSTVEQACRAYWAQRLDTTERYRKHVLRALELHIFPAIGAVPVAALTREQLLRPLLVLDAQAKAEYPRRCRIWVSQVLAQCVERSECATNHASTIQPQRAFSRRVVKHFPALDPAEVPAFMARLELEGEIQAALACRLLALTWARTNELRMMRWEEVDGDLWRLPAGRMKRRKDHLVPLSAQAMAVLARMQMRRKGSDY